MDQKTDTLLNSPTKPSKLLALLALFVAFSLPFLLVKLFPHKHKTTITNLSLTLPKIEAAAPPVTNLPAENKEQVTAAIPERAPPTVQKSEWRIIKTTKRDSLAAVFNRAHISNRVLAAIQKDNPHANLLTKLQPNQEIQFLLKANQLEKMIFPLTTTQYIVVTRNNEHYQLIVNTRKMNSHNHFLTATVKGSLYATAQRLKIPSKLVQQMTDIFSWDINFSKDVHPGDQFTIIYKAFYIEDKLVGTGDILAVSYHTAKQSFQAIRHTNRQGQVDYYAPDGSSLRKAFNRYPLRFSHISSTFSLARYHPILHHYRSHKGVDLAAPIGTPIQATGDGRIELIGRQNGYGNMIKIAHNKSYSTIYGHMLKFQKDLSRGSYVKRGQVIGYVGQTGLATGPHCHYEIRMNNQAKNPTTISLPRGNPVPQRELASFKMNTQTLLAQLKLFEDGHRAGAKRNV